MKRTIVAVFIGMLALGASAQKDSTTTQKAQFKISMNYNSGFNYYGRTDSLKSSGFFPLAELWFTPNFYVNAAPIFVHNKVQPAEYAGSVTTLGYLYSSKKVMTNVYVLKPFYKQSAELVQAALKAQTGASISLLNKVLNLTIGGDAKWSDKMDFGASAGVDHMVRVQAGSAVLVFDPSVYVYAGTQQFSQSYIQKNNSLLFPRSTTVTEKVQAFNVLSYEASMPVIIAKGKLQFILTPAFVMPKNLLQVANRPDLSESGENMFYTTAAIKYTF